MDDKQRFDNTFEQLTPRRREVLKLFLAGKTDGQIASQFFIEETTVRKHIENICAAFDLEEGRDRRERLKALFAKHKPELIPDAPPDTPPTHDEPQDEIDPKITPLTGVVPRNSPLYIQREADRQCQEILKTASHHPVFVRLRGARGCGKSSLLVRLQHWLETEQKQVVGFVDLGGFNFEPEAFTNLNKLLYQFTYAVTQSFSSAMPNHPPNLQKNWQEDVAAASNCTDYLENYIFAKIKQPKTLIIDGIDKILGRKETQTPFLNLLRSWYERKMKDVGQGKIVWPNLVIADSTEPYAHYEIQDSPLQNVGNQIELQEFNTEEILELAKCYGIEINFNDSNSLKQLLGGNPALLNPAIYQLSKNYINLTQLIDRATEVDGPFAYFLQKNLKQLQVHDNLMNCFKEILQGNKCSDEFAKYQLELAGLIRGYPFNVQVSCELYQEFFKAYLGLDNAQ